MIKDKKSLKASTPSRRKFFKAAAVTGAAAATAVAMPNIATADGHVTLKMQAAWPSGANIFLKWQETIVKWLATCLVDHLKLIFSPLTQS